METLTKENFWNELMEKHPSEMKQFCNWIDEYKKRIGWENLFGAHKTMQNGRCVCVGFAPKYHELPTAMQMGIFMQFVAETRNIYWTDITIIEAMEDFKKIIDIIFNQIK